MAGNLTLVITGVRAIFERKTSSFLAETIGNVASLDASESFGSKNSSSSSFIDLISPSCKINHAWSRLFYYTDLKGSRNVYIFKCQSLRNNSFYI